MAWTLHEGDCLDAVVTHTPDLKAPFPWFGGKRRVAGLVWPRFGAVNNYIEPFFGSGAVLLCRPLPAQGVETVNDLDGFVANFWRATKSDPDAVADAADQPVNENDLHARHAWLVERRGPLCARLEGDPDYFDAKIAGWWAWGVSCWIGSGFCSGRGPWRSEEVAPGDRQLVRLDNAGRGVKRQIVHLNAGHGVNRQSDDRHGSLLGYFRELAARLRRVRVCCGDWFRVMGDTVMLTGKNQAVGVFLDPPYADTAGRNARLYAEDSLTVAHAVRDWAVAHGGSPRYRIALCGYEGEHEMPPDWERVAWKSGPGYGSQSKAGHTNKGRERIWFSPHCLRPGEAPAGLAQVATVLHKGQTPLFPNH